MNNFGNPADSLTNRQLKVRSLKVSSLEKNKLLQITATGTLESTPYEVQDLGPTGSVEFADLSISGDLTVLGATTTIASTDLEIKDSIIVLAKDGIENQNAGILIEHAGLYSGLIRDKTTKEFNLCKNRATMPTIVEAITYDYATLNVDALKTLSGLVDGVDIIQRDTDLKTVETTLANISLQAVCDNSIEPTFISEGPPIVVKQGITMLNNLPLLAVENKDSNYVFQVDSEGVQTTQITSNKLVLTDPLSVFTVGIEATPTESFEWKLPTAQNTIASGGVLGIDNTGQIEYTEITLQQAYNTNANIDITGPITLSDAATGNNMLTIADNVGVRTRLQSDGKIYAKEFHTGIASINNLGDATFNNITVLGTAVQTEDVVISDAKNLVLQAGLESATITSVGLTDSYTITLPTAMTAGTNLPLLISSDGKVSYNDQAVKTTSDVSFNNLTLTGSVLSDVKVASNKTLQLRNPLNTQSTTLSSGSSTADINFVLPPVVSTLANAPLLCGTDSKIIYGNQAVQTTSAPSFAGLSLTGSVSTDVRLIAGKSVVLTNVANTRECGIKFNGTQNYDITLPATNNGAIPVNRPINNTAGVWSYNDQSVMETSDVKFNTVTVAGLGSFNDLKCTNLFTDDIEIKTQKDLIFNNNADTKKLTFDWNGTQTYSLRLPPITPVGIGGDKPMIANATAECSWGDQSVQSGSNVVWGDISVNGEVKTDVNFDQGKKVIFHRNGTIRTCGISAPNLDASYEIQLPVAVATSTLPVVMGNTGVLSYGQSIATTSVPTFGGLTSNGNIVMAALATVDGVDVSVLGTTVSSNINQDVKDSSSPSFVRVNLSDGSAAAPALRFTTNQNTGLYTDGGNNLKVAVGGVDTFDISSSNIQAHKDVSLSAGASLKLKNNANTFTTTLAAGTSTASYIATLPTALPVSTLPLQMSNTGLISYGVVAAADTLQSAYNGGKTIATSLAKGGSVAIQCYDNNVDAFTVRNAADFQVFGINGTKMLGSNMDIEFKQGAFTGGLINWGKYYSMLYLYQPAIVYENVNLDGKYFSMGTKNPNNITTKNVVATSHWYPPLNALPLTTKYITCDSGGQLDYISPPSLQDAYDVNREIKTTNSNPLKIRNPTSGTAQVFVVRAMNDTIDKFAISSSGETVITAPLYVNDNDVNITTGRLIVQAGVDSTSAFIIKSASNTDAVSISANGWNTNIVLNPNYNLHFRSTVGTNIYISGTGGTEHYTMKLPPTLPTSTQLLTCSNTGQLAYQDNVAATKSWGYLVNPVDLLSIAPFYVTNGSPFMISYGTTTGAGFDFKIGGDGILTYEGKTPKTFKIDWHLSGQRNSGDEGAGIALRLYKNLTSPFGSTGYMSYQVNLGGNSYMSVSGSGFTQLSETNTISLWGDMVSSNATEEFLFHDFFMSCVEA